jgi:hypothetical protein
MGNYVSYYYDQQPETLVPSKDTTTTTTTTTHSADKISIPNMDSNMNVIVDINAIENVNAIATLPKELIKQIINYDKTNLVAVKPLDTDVDMEIEPETKISDESTLKQNHSISDIAMECDGGEKLVVDLHKQKHKKSRKRGRK